MAKARRPTGAKAASRGSGAKTDGAAAKKRTPSAAKIPAKAAQRKGKAAASEGLSLYDPKYEKPLSELPPLTFPNSAEYEFRLTAEQQRRARVRNEALFGGLLLVGGVVGLVAGHTPAVLVLAAVAGGSMAAYELIISGLE